MMGMIAVVLLNMIVHVFLADGLCFHEAGKLKVGELSNEQ